MSIAASKVCEMDLKTVAAWAVKASKATHKPAAPWHELVVREWIGIERPSRGQRVPTWRALVDPKFKPSPYKSPSVIAMDADCAELAVLQAYVASIFGESLEHLNQYQQHIVAE